ncbi:hypothetical protein EXS65_01265 [Candidatus Peribacteria bacterium]|nr:hypothetical protein [Candidatus Peribacteria bacterium]
MIMSLLFSIDITLLLLLEGALIARLILRTNRLWLLLSLGLPIAAFLNVLIVFDWTLLGVPLTPLSLLLPHAIVTGILAILACKVSVSHQKYEHLPASKGSRNENILAAFCLALIAVSFVYSFAHAVLLPTFQYDSATNWTMRSKISFEDQSIAFDTNEDRGMAKPQYPFLFHALQITVNQGQTRWNDAAANAILWLLSFSSFLGIFLILRGFLERTSALVTVTMILGIPLLSLHLGQGYADIVLLQEFLLSLACLLAWNKSGEGKWLMLSGIFVAASVWTKSEGLVFGLLPWLLIVLSIAIFMKEHRKAAFRNGALTVALSIAWPLFALSRGFLLTPHGSDTSVAFHPEGLPEVLLGMFDRGSFGIAWYVLLITVPWMIVEVLRKRDCRKELLPLAWGLMVFLEVIFVYLFTPNVQFLQNAQSYYRQMMIPAAMLMLTVCAWFSAHNPPVETQSRS